MPSPHRTLSRDQALAIAASMFAPTGEDLIGLECEWPVRDWHDPYGRPELATLQSLAEPPLPGGGRITIEPGGQVEVSSFPAHGVSQAIDRMNWDSEEVHARLLSLGMNFEVRAVERMRHPHRILEHPRYRSMEAFFDARNPVGRWMMCNTASLQVNVSNDTVDPHHRWFTLGRIAPVLVAMFANSRGYDASGQTWASLRQGIWLSMDPGHTSPVRLDTPPEQAWLSYALDAHVMHVLDPQDPGAGTAIAPGLTFGSWLDHGTALGFPTADDLRYHFSTLFPPVRPRGWIELRVLDAIPSWMRTAAALTVATAVHAPASAEICRRLPDLSGRHLSAARYGLADPALLQASQDLVDIVRAHVGAVTSRPDHIEAMCGFFDRYTVHGISPGDDGFQHLPIALDSLTAASTI